MIIVIIIIILIISLITIITAITMYMYIILYMLIYPIICYTVGLHPQDHLGRSLALKIINGLNQDGRGKATTLRMAPKTEDR